MKITLTPVIAATLFASANAFSSYLNTMGGGTKAVEKYVPSYEIKTPVPIFNGAGSGPVAAAPVAAASAGAVDRFGNSAKVEKYVPNYEIRIPVPIFNGAGSGPVTAAAPAKYVPAAAAPAPAAGLDRFGSTGKVEKYVPNYEIRIPVPIFNGAGSGPVTAAAPAKYVPAAAAPVKVTSSGNYLDQFGGGKVEKYVPSYEIRTPVPIFNGAGSGPVTAAATAKYVPAPAAVATPMAATVATPVAAAVAAVTAGVTAVHHHTHNHQHNHDHHHHHTHNHQH